jgi:hypothetical protein
VNPDLDLLHLLVSAQRAIQDAHSIVNDPVLRDRLHEVGKDVGRLLVAAVRDQAAEVVA